MKIKEHVKESSIYKQINNFQRVKNKYAAPGYDEISMNVYSYLISLLSFEYEQQNLTLANYIENNAIDSANNDPQQYVKEYSGGYHRFNTENNRPYISRREIRKSDKGNQKLAVMNYSQPRDVIDLHKDPERIDIEK